MARYHISPRTGSPVVCKAEFRCPFGDLQKDHYPSREDAQFAYEQKMKQREIPSFSEGNINITELPESMIIDEKTILMPKGMYVLGDTSLNLQNKDFASWRKFQKEISSDFFQHRKTAFGACWNSYPVVSLKTKYGNGLYFDNSGRDYPVETQTLGLVPLSLLKRMGVTEEEMLRAHTSIISFDEPTKVQYRDGTLFFGDDLQVFTDVEESEEIEDDVDEILESLGSDEE